MENSDFWTKIGGLEQCVQHEKGKWLKMDNGFTLLQSDCSESTLQTKGIPAVASKPILWSETCVCYFGGSNKRCFRIRAREIGFGQWWQWLGGSRQTSFLTFSFAHGYFMGKIVVTQWAKSIEKVTKYSRQMFHKKVFK